IHEDAKLFDPSGTKLSMNDFLGPSAASSKVPDKTAFLCGFVWILVAQAPQVLHASASVVDDGVSFTWRLVRCKHLMREILHRPDLAPIEDFLWSAGQRFVRP